MIENSYIPKAKLNLIQYNSSNYDESVIEDLNVIDSCIKDGSVSWIDIDGTHCNHTIDFLTKKLGLHPLLLEDIHHQDHRPKMDDYEDYVFVMVKMLDFDEKKGKIKTEQISFILGKNYLISFQETGKSGDIFDPIRSRIKNSLGRHRSNGSDYLLYSLIDTIIDHYFVILEKIGEKIEVLEDEIFSHPTTEKLNEIYKLKRELIHLRHSVWPLREVLNKMNKSDSKLISQEVQIYLREVYDHSIQVIETLESYRDILSGLIDIYLSSLSNKMNSVMKVLTVISTIFMPLTFIVGAYGMNFQYIPLSKWANGYYFILVFCAILAGGMLVYFRKKKWL